MREKIPTESSERNVNTAHESMLAKWKAALRAAGLRQTKQRMAVLEILAEATIPVTHAEVTARLSRAGYDRATIYRNLISLMKIGLVVRSDHGDHVWRFAVVRVLDRSTARKSAHFLCTDCGAMSSLPDGVVRLVPNEGVPQAVLAQSVQIQVRGRCDRCDEA
jgi:Fur family ferric uptake transcriptional regulator